MFTHNYKGLYIHGYCDKSECTVSFESGAMLPSTAADGKTFKSYRAAQLAISKFLNR